MRFKVLGLCAMVLGLLAIPASNAQASAYMLASVTIVELTVKIKLVFENNKATLLSTVNGLSLELTCTAGEAVNMALEGSGKVTNGGKIKFTGCKVFNGGKATACEPHSPGQPVGTIETTGTKGQLQLNAAKEGVIIFEPTTGTTFANVEMGEKCAFGEEVPIKGKLGVKDCSNKFETELVTHLISEEPSTTTILALNNKATFDASILVTTTGGAIHENKTWSALPL